MVAPCRAAAHAAGVRLFSVTYHDTLAGVRELLRSGAAPLPAGLQLIPGVEINAVNSPRDSAVGVVMPRAMKPD